MKKGDPKKGQLMEEISTSKSTCQGKIIYIENIQLKVGRHVFTGAFLLTPGAYLQKVGQVMSVALIHFSCNIPWGFFSWILGVDLFSNQMKQTNPNSLSQKPMVFTELPMFAVFFFFVVVVVVVALTGSISRFFCSGDQQKLGPFTSGMMKTLETVGGAVFVQKLTLLKTNISSKNVGFQ